MDLMVVPRPIFTPSKEVKGYYLSFQVGNALIEEGKGLGQTFDLGLNYRLFDFVNEIGLEVLTMNKLTFVPVTDILLVSDIESYCKADRSLIVLMLNKNNQLTGSILERVIELKNAGFTFAFFNYPSIAAMEPFLPYVDYVFSQNDTEIMMPIVRYIRAHRREAKVIATKVDADRTFDRVSRFGLTLFTGHFYKVPTGKDAEVSPLQVNYIQLLNQVANEDFEFDEFTKIVQRDTALAIQFLRMVNSSFVGSNKIKSLRHAAAMIGAKEIKRWITTAVSSTLSQNKPSEVTRVSLLRAKFCENLAGQFGMGVHSENLFLMGLFSVLDVILDMSIEKALDLVTVPDDVRVALTDGGNEFGKVYEFIVQYEQAEWTEISRTAIEREMEIKDIYAAYYEALEWYGRLINMQLDENEILTEDDE